MLTFFQAIIIGLLQGITELFPVSSLGHSVILPTLLGWQIDQNSSTFLIFIIATHFATALVLFIFFFKDWVLIIKGIVRSLRNRFINPNDTYEKLGWMIIIATIPVGILGILFQEKVQALLASAKYVSLFLILNGLMLYGAEYLRKNKAISVDRDVDAKVSKISWFDSIKVGLAQCIALIPGFSRTGSTLGAGLFVGLDHEASARFSFLLATPVIFAASVLKLPELLQADANTSLPIIVGALMSALGAYVSIKFLSKYFKTKTLTPFAIYCIVAGALSFIILVIR